MPRVPLTVPVADKVPLPPSPRFFGGFQCTGYQVLVEENEEHWVVLHCYVAVLWLGVTPRRAPWPDW